MSYEVSPKLYAIRNKKTFNFLVIRGRLGWTSPSAAKSAYWAQTYDCKEGKGKDIKQSSEWEIVCINGLLV